MLKQVSQVIKNTITPFGSVPDLRGCRSNNPRQPARVLALTFLGTVALLTVGCGGKPGIKWHFTSYEDALDIAQREDQLAFIYFRDWYSAECARFEEEVLKHPDVRNTANNMVSVPLEFFWVKPLARELSIRKVPGWAVVTPAGRALVQGEGYTPVNEMLEALRAARQEYRQSQGNPPPG